MITVKSNSGAAVALTRSMLFERLRWTLSLLLLTVTYQFAGRKRAMQQCRFICRGI
jgi:hypothetical protein